MNKEIADKWIAALRSGKYKQGKGNLKTVDEDNNESFCCLGVLCDIAPKELAEFETKKDPESRNIFNSRYIKDKMHGGLRSCSLPESIKEWAGMFDCSGRLRDHKKYIATKNEDQEKYAVIWALNDDVGMSFEEIADIIEEKWEDI